MKIEKQVLSKMLGKISNDYEEFKKITNEYIEQYSEGIHTTYTIHASYYSVINILHTHTHITLHGITQYICYTITITLHSVELS